MKSIFSVLVLSVCVSANAQKHSLERVWETDTVIAVPESVLFADNILYVAQIDGSPWGVDGKGGVAKLALDGKVINANWITGLHAPKGMARVGNRLYVADIGDVVIIDVKKGAIEKRVKIEGADGLNDVTATNKGIVYVSDSKAGKVWRIEKDVAALFLDNQQGVNGLKAINDDVFIAAGKSFVKASSDKKITKVADLPSGGDGIEPVGNGDFIVTAWAGEIYYISADGKVDTILDTKAEKKNTADIGYDPAKKIVYVPTFNAKTVAAYRLQ